MIRRRRRTQQNEVAGLICESLAYDVLLPDAAGLLLKGISHLAPHLHVYTLKNEVFSRDPEAVARMNNDLLIEKESQPAETSAEMLKAADRLTENFPKFTVPVLILHGTADKATRPGDVSASTTWPARRTRRSSSTRANSTTF